MKRLWRRRPRVRWDWVLMLAMFLLLAFIALEVGTLIGIVWFVIHN